MSIELIKNYLPEHSLPYLKTWFGQHQIYIRITRDRNSKLGDYRKKPDGSYLITINSTLQQDLFFFVLTHELAHLLAFHRYGQHILPHGKEWKSVFREMLHASISVYPEDLQAIILHFARSPKANFMASDGLVRYFYSPGIGEQETFMETLLEGDFFVYRSQEFQVLHKLKKNYLCKNLKSDKNYIFKPLVSVQKKN